MKQGEIWELYLDPVKGSEQSGRRPAIILSGNLLNKHLEVVIVCPLSTKIKNYKGNIVLSPNEQNGLKHPSEIFTFHIRSVSKERLKNRLGNVEPSIVQELKGYLNDILTY
ncbi:MAG: type II toxin-antitoxin system PemK/MazF family toxin [Bacteroidota bacterium]